MTAPLWTPATPDDLIAWGQGYTAGYDTGHAAGYRGGRILGYIAGREGLAGDLVTALRYGLAGVNATGDLDAHAVIDALARPFREVMDGHLRAVDKLEARRAWDAANRLEVRGG